MTFVLQLTPQTSRRMFENIGHGLESSRTAGRYNRGAAVEADTIGELQLKRTQSGGGGGGGGGSSRSGRNREGAVEAERCNWGAAAETHTIGEQQLCTERSSAGLLT